MSIEQIQIPPSKYMALILGTVEYSYNANTNPSKLIVLNFSCCVTSTQACICQAPSLDWKTMLATIAMPH